MGKRVMKTTVRTAQAAPSIAVDPQAAFDLIARAPVFCGLPAEGHAFLAANARAAAYKPGELVGGEGMTHGFMFGLLNGRLRGVKFSPEGRRLIFMHMEPGDWAGFYWVLDEGAAVMDVEAVEKSVCLKIERKALSEAGRRWPGLYEGLYVELLRRTRPLFVMVELGVAHSLEVRVATVLLKLLARHRKDTAEGILLDLPVSQTELAGLALCSRQHVNRVLGRWVERGVVSVAGPRAIIVHDLPALEAEAHRTGH